MNKTKIQINALAASLLVGAIGFVSQASGQAVIAGNGGGATFGNALIHTFTGPEFLVTTTNTGAVIGYEFTTPSTGIVVVTELGFWDDNGDGFASGVDVGLFSSSGDLLGWVPIASGTDSPLGDDNFRYEPLDSSIFLENDTSYVLGGFRMSGVNYAGRNTTAGTHFQVFDGFLVNEERAGSLNGGETELIYPSFNGFPNTLSPGEAILGPNLRFDTIPEPSTYALMAGGLLAIFAVRRRKS